MQPPSREHTPPKSTGIKTVDAVLYVVYYFFVTAKRDKWVFTFIILLIIAATGWGFYIVESKSADKRVEIARKEEREMCQREMSELKNDISDIQIRYLELEKEFKAAEKDANASVTQLYERLLQYKKEEK